MSGTYHVSFTYKDFRGLETFDEFTVQADSEDDAIYRAEHRDGAPEEYDEVEVRAFDTEASENDGGAE